MAANPERRYTLGEHLELDRTSEERLEFWGGEVFGEKFTHYESIPTLREYLLVAQHRPHVTRPYRQDDGKWIHTAANESAATLTLDSPGCDLPPGEICRGVGFDAPATN